MTNTPPQVYIFSVVDNYPGVHLDTTEEGPDCLFDPILTQNDSVFT
jgi:hypothetical protein